MEGDCNVHTLFAMNAPSIRMVCTEGKILSLYQGAWNDNWESNVDSHF